MNTRSFKYAWVLDKLKAERERGITIDIALCAAPPSTHPSNFCQFFACALLLATCWERPTLHHITLLFHHTHHSQSIKIKS